MVANQWILIGLILFFTFNYIGFCFKSFRFLSDEEKIRLAVIDVGKDDYSGRGTRLNGSRYIKKIIPYPSTEEFFKQNPNCCQVVYKHFNDDIPPSFFERLFGVYSYGVRMTYTEKYIMSSIDKNGKISQGQIGQRQIKDSFFTAGNCGCFYSGSDDAILPLSALLMGFFR